MTKLIAPVIKWSGSKRHQAPFLKSLFPPNYNRYFEPFVGGGSMLPYQDHEAYASDSMEELIGIWRTIKTTPKLVAVKYKIMWEKLQEDPDYFYEIRTRFNQKHNPVDFLFLTRTCYNGLIRFNASGEFNTSLHFNRPGLHPDKMAKIIDMWQGTYLQNVTFSCQDYRQILNQVKIGDFVFLDPPYAGTKGQYKADASKFDYSDFELFLEGLNLAGVKWLLTLGGSDDYELPSWIYTSKQLSPKFSSRFSRMKQRDKQVGDMICANYKPLAKSEITE